MPSRRSFRYNRYPQILTPSRHPDRQPLILPPQLDPSCILCFLPMNDNKWFDYSGKGNHGTVYGPTKTSKGRNGFGWSFNGLDDYIDAGISATLQNSNGNITIESWLKWHAVTELYNSVLADEAVLGGGYTLLLKSNQKLAFYWTVISSDGLGPTVVSFDVWHQIGVTYDKSNIITFVDGEVDFKNPATGNQITPSDSRFFIGKSVFESGRYFNGLIGELRIYNRALSALEIKALYEMGRP